MQDGTRSDGFALSDRRRRLKVRQWLRPAIENRFPLAAEVYRAARDAVQLRRATPSPIGNGLVLAGDTKAQSGEFEPEVREIMHQWFPKIDAFVDVGANVGLHSVLAASCGISTISIEPHPRNLAYLFQNLIRNGLQEDVEVWPVAVGSKPTILDLYGTGATASLVPGWSNAHASYRRPVPVSTLDIILLDRFRGQRLLIKVDAEGSEFEVISGAAGLLNMSPPPTWIVEIYRDPRRRSGVNPLFEKSFQAFFGAGYSALGIEDGKVMGSKEIQAIEFGEEAQTSLNFLFHQLG